MNRYIYYFLCFSLLMVSCRQDEFNEDIVVQGPTDTGELKIGDVVGLVTAADGSTIAGAEVLLAGERLTTDDNGYFKFDDIELDVAGSVLKVRKESYFDNYKFVTTETESQSYVQVQLVETAVIDRFPSGTAKVVTGPTGAEISFQADAYTRDGAAYNGEVIVRFHWYDPSSENLSATMPGDLRGVDSQGAVVQLATLGMMAVGLSAPDGTELQLAEGKEATLSFPLTPEMVSDVTGDIPLWSLDETTGVWVEEGVATLVGDMMVGQVSHFSFWNCDVPFPVVQIEGRLVTSSGDPLPNYKVEIRVKDSFITGSGVTDSNGVFGGKVPRDEPLELIVEYCGSIILQQDLGIISGYKNLDDITIVFNDIEKSVSGRLVDCMGSPVTEGYVVVRSGNTVELLVPDANGNFSGIAKFCGMQEVLLKAYDPIGLSETEPVMAENNTDPLDLGDWTVCGGNLEERILYSLNGGTNNLMSEARVSLVDNELLHIYAEDLLSGFVFDTEVKLTDVGTLPAMKTQIAGVGINSPIIASAFCGSYLRNSGTVCEDLQITITEFGGVGEWVMGTMTGFINTGTDIVDIEASFQVYLDESIQTGRVEGKIWIDTNRDGLQDAGDVPLSGINLSLGGKYLGGMAGGITERPRIYPLDIEGLGVAGSDADGNYYRDGLVSGEDYTLSYGEVGVVSPYGVTSPNQGDDTIDSDFTPEFPVFDAISVYVIDGFTDSGLESNVDLGLTVSGIDCQIAAMGCGPDAYIEVNPVGGVPPYEITLNGTTTLPPGENRFENLAPGTYNVSIRDQTVLACSGDHTVQEFQNKIEVQVWQDLDSGVPDVFDETVANPGNWTITLNLYRENGNLVAITTTDAKGQARFRYIEPGTYKVSMTLPNNFEYVQMSVGPDENADSDMDPLTNFTDEIMFTDNCDGEGSLTIGIREL